MTAYQEFSKSSLEIGWEMKCPQARASYSRGTRPVSTTHTAELLILIYNP